MSDNDNMGIVPPVDVLKTLPQSAIAGISCDCAANGNLSGLKSIKEVGGNLSSATPYDQRTPLHLAAATGNLSIAKFLVEECGVKLQKDARGLLPIHDAVQCNHVEMRRYLQAQRLKEDASAATPQSFEEEMQATVFELVVKEGVFLYTTVQKEVEYYFKGLGLHPIYFRHFTPMQVSKHVNCLIASKRVVQTTRAGFDSLRFSFAEDRAGFFLATLNRDLTETVGQKETEDAVSEYISESFSSPDTAVSMFFMASEKAVAPSSGDQQLGLYCVNRSMFDTARSKIKGNETSLEVLASSRFLKEKTKTVKEQYQIQMEEVITFSRNVCRVLPTKEYNGCADSEGYVLMFSTAETIGRNYFAEVSQACRFQKMRPTRVYMEGFLNGVVTYTLFFPKSSYEDVVRMKSAIMYSTLLKSSPGKSEVIFNNVMQGNLSLDVGLYVLSAVKFVYTFFPKEKYAREYTDVHRVLERDPNSQLKLESLYKLCMKELLSPARIYDVITRHLDLAREFFDDFKKIALGHAEPAYNEALGKAIEKSVVDPQDRQIMKMFLTFNSAILLTNFFAPETPTAFSYRLDPSVVLKDRPTSLYPAIPYGIYMVVGRNFMGFHCRFRDVARGGIRLVRSRDTDVYDRNAATLFEECYNLSYTQQLKNKDIPEGGAKGVILPDSPKESQTDEAAKLCFTRYLNALLDCMLPENSKIFTGHMKGKPEILYFGPDEGTAGMMDLGAKLARDRGYPYWKALTTGKTPKLGGIAHDVFGMTTASVHTYVLELLKALGEDESKITKIQTGGPDGDLGSNEILVSKDKTIAIVDGSGVIYDPNGLNRTELVRLARARVMVREFNRSFLGEGSFLVTVDDKDVTLPNGSFYRTGAELRDTFMVTDYATADLLVPCGGRPNTITTENVHKLFDAGKPKFRMVVEGANLFMSNGARAVLEKAGVHLFKDASTNKGGVNSSSLEVLAALALPPDDHAKLMTFDTATGGIAPAFYNEYAQQIVDIVKENARHEFQAIWKYNQATGLPKVECTALLSKQITRMQDSISEQLTTMADESRDALVTNVVSQAVPKLMVDRLGVQGIVSRVPDNYVNSIIGSWIASRYVYTYGIGASEVTFFFFMQKLLNGQSSATKKRAASDVDSAEQDLQVKAPRISA